MFKKIQRIIFSNNSFLLVAIIGANFINFLYSTFLGRTLSFESFGLIGIMTSLYTLIYFFLNSLAATVNYFTAFLGGKQQQSKTMNFYSVTVKNVLLIATLCSGIWLLFTPVTTRFLAIDNVSVLLLFTPLIFFGTFSAINKGFLQGNFLFYTVGFLILLEPLSKLFLGIIFVFSPFRYWTFLSIPCSVVITGLLSSVFIRNKFNPGVISKKLYAFPMKFYVASLVSGFSTMAFMTFDMIFVKHYFSPVAAGEYAVLTLVGKMIFFFGSLCNVFIYSFVARDLGTGKKGLSSFYLIFLANLSLTVIGFLGVGIFGNVTVPWLFGKKAFVILRYLPYYSLAITFLVFSNTIVTFHIALKRYIFSHVTIGMAVLMCLTFILLHQTIMIIALDILGVSVVNFALVGVLHFYYENKSIQYGRLHGMRLIKMLKLFKGVKEVGYETA